MSVVFLTLHRVSVVFSMLYSSARQTSGTPGEKPSGLFVPFYTEDFEPMERDPKRVRRLFRSVLALKPGHAIRKLYWRFPWELRRTNP